MRHRKRNLMRGAVGALAAAAALVTPVAQADERAELEASFTTRAPGTPTGLRLAAEYKNPSDPNAKPPPLEGAAFDLPPGTRIDTSAAPRCTATDDQIRALGRHACPPESKVAEGRLVAMTGTPADPFDGEALFFNGDGQIIEIVLVRGSDQAAGFDRITVDGSTLTAHPPTIPGGPPDGRTAIRRVELNAPVRSEGGRPYITTPPACDGEWLARGRFKFGDGGATTISTPLPCDRTKAASLTLRVSPTRVRAGRRAALRVRVTSKTAGCASGASVRLGRARATTGADGRAILRKKLSTPRVVTVRAAKPGCGRATASVRVMR
jgi:hypothetical protein